jgi:hypothetical protein
MPVLLAQPAGPIIYVDGHMMAFYVAAVVKPSCILFSPLSSLGAVSHRAGSSCGFLWRAALPLPMPFYPFGFRNRPYRLTISYG